MSIHTCTRDCVPVCTQLRRGWVAAPTPTSVREFWACWQRFWWEDEEPWDLYPEIADAYERERIESENTPIYDALTAERGTA